MPPRLVSPDSGSLVTSPVTFVWQGADVGAPAEGYIIYLDSTPVITFTTPITSTSLDVLPWEHSWSVKANNGFGASLPSTTWGFNVFGKLYLPLIKSNTSS
jgi:hypothetical protein